MRAAEARRSLLWWLLPPVGLATALAVLWALTGMMALFLLPILGGCAYAAISARRRRRGRMIVLQLRQITSMALPLPVMLRRAAEGETGRLKRRLEAVAARLERGETLHETLAREAEEVGARTLRVIEAAERSGRLSDALAWLAAEDGVPREDESRVADWLLPAVEAAFVATGVGVLLTLVWPKYREIFEEYGVGPVTMWPAIDVDVAGLLMAAGIALWAALVLGLAAAAVSRRVAGLMRAAAAMAGSVIPWVGGMMRARRMADACFIMASALKSGASVHDAAESAAGAAGDAVGRRLKRWARRLKSGGEISVSAQAAGLPRLFGALLAAPGSDLPERMEFLAHYFRSRFVRGAELMRAAVLPMATLALAVMVGFTAVMFMRPLAWMMQAVMPGGGGVP